VQNAFSYLRDPEASFLIEPGSSTGTLAERGANWLFVRWIADHFGGGDPYGTSLTRALVATNRLGAANVTAATSAPFPTLAAEWQLANFLDNLPSFTPANPRLQYTSWNFRQTFASLNQQNPGTFNRPFPLVPDSTLTGAYSRQGVLRAGSGRHLRVVQSPAAALVDLELLDTTGAALGAVVVPRVGVVRVR
jgi:hypothetical protein